MAQRSGLGPDSVGGFELVHDGPAERYKSVVGHLSLPYSIPECFGQIRNPAFGYPEERRKIIATGRVGKQVGQRTRSGRPYLVASLPGNTGYSLRLLRVLLQQVYVRLKAKGYAMAFTAHPLQLSLLHEGVEPGGVIRLKAGGKNLRFPGPCLSRVADQLFETKFQPIDIAQRFYKPLVLRQKQGQPFNLQGLKFRQSLSPGQSQQDFKILAVANLLRSSLSDKLPLEGLLRINQIFQGPSQPFVSDPESPANEFDRSRAVKLQPFPEQHGPIFHLPFLGRGTQLFPRERSIRQRFQMKRLPRVVEGVDNPGQHFPGSHQRPRGLWRMELNNFILKLIQQGFRINPVVPVHGLEEKEPLFFRDGQPFPDPIEKLA